MVVAEQAETAEAVMVVEGGVEKEEEETAVAEKVAAGKAAAGREEVAMGGWRWRRW